MTLWLVKTLDLMHDFELCRLNNMFLWPAWIGRWSIRMKVIHF